MSADASGTLFKQTCEFCGAAVNTLRRGRCWGCYQRWQQAQPVGRGANCVVCGERRNANLQRVELFNRWLPMCHICATRTRSLQPTPASVDGIRAALRRDRRRKERRKGQPDTRLSTKERRGPDRRALPVDEADIVSIEPLSPEDQQQLAELALKLAWAPTPGDATRIYDPEHPEAEKTAAPADDSSNSAESTAGPAETEPTVEPRPETSAVASPEAQALGRPQGVADAEAEVPKETAADAGGPTTIFERLDDEELVAIEDAGALPGPPPRRRKPTRKRAAKLPPPRKRTAKLPPPRRRKAKLPPSSLDKN
jgi:hypothetical protein